MNYLLGGVAVACCFAVSSFDVFTGTILDNVGWWGVGISILYVVLSSFERTKSSST